MNQQEADKIFNTGLGQQLDSFYCYNNLPESMDIGNNELGHY